MRALLAILAIVVIGLIVAFLFGFIDISQTRTAQLPTIQVSGGQAPAFAVSTAKVDIGTKPKTVEVPKVDVGTKTTNVDVPTVNVSKP